MTFYKTAGGKDASKTAGHFAVSPKTFYKWQMAQNAAKST